MHSGDVLEQKLNRIRSGQPIRVLDLFSGCGGFSLGFSSLGFEIVGGIEVDHSAVETFARNFYSNAPQPVRAARSAPIDITETDPEAASRMLELGHVASAVDVIVGGPPCQAFSRIGRAKLRDLAAHPEAYKEDRRARLYLRYLEYVRDFRPLALVMENVPDSLNYGGHNIPAETCETLSDLGYECGYTLLNSVFYGVPQFRERMFLIAYARELKAHVEFPKTTHWARLPKGYEQIRAAASNGVRFDLFQRDYFFQSAPDAVPQLEPSVTVRTAIGDLPKITRHLEMGYDPRKSEQALMLYSKSIIITNYARMMRTWNGKHNDVVTAHVTRHLPRDYPIFGKMGSGDRYPEARQIAKRLLLDLLEAASAEGRSIVPGSPEYEALEKRVVPPYDPAKFSDKWHKLDPDQPSHTLLAHLGKDCYSHIHYDSEQRRTITVREAARLQSFPDSFEFGTSLGAAYRQIGNSVPPLMARALASAVKGAITRALAQPGLELAAEDQATVSGDI